MGGAGWEAFPTVQGAIPTCEVARKWMMLVEAYKRVKDNNALTGRGPVHFLFYMQMGKLIGGNHDVDPAVGGSDCASVVVRRPVALRQSNSAPSPVTASPRGQ